jgi:hypothetical protein
MPGRAQLLKFNLMVSANCEPTLASGASAISGRVDRVDAVDWRDRQMPAQRKVPILVAAIIAVVGQAVIIFNDFGPGNNSQGSGNARMITAAAVSRAGAIEIPSAPPAGRSVS